MKNILLLFCLIAAAPLMAQPAVITLGNKVQVTFPGTTKITSDVEGIKVFQYSKDSIVIYGALAMDRSLMGIAKDVKIDAAYWNLIKKGMLQEMTNAVLKKDEVIQFKGRSCLKVELDVSNSKFEDLKGKNLYAISFFTDSGFYQLSVLSRAAESNFTEAEIFFNSLKIE